MNNTRKKSGPTLVKKAHPATHWDGSDDDEEDDLGDLEYTEINVLTLLIKK
jgi:hypothetical protein